MFASATPEERQRLDQRTAALWQELQGRKSFDALRGFVEGFGSLSRTGKEARLKLAERLLDDPDPLSLLEAERHLYLLRGPGEEPALQAQALECLARLNVRKGRPHDAAYYYRLLRRDFARVVVRDGKTGTDILDELAADKRFLPYLDEPERLGSAGKIRASEERGAFPFSPQIYQLGQIGERLPFFQENKLVIRYQPHSLRVLDPASGEEKWSQILTDSSFGNLASGSEARQVRFSYLNLGHLVVLPLGHVVFGIDPINRKLLWEKNLYTGGGEDRGQGSAPPVQSQLVVDPLDGSLLVTYQDGWVQRLGTGGVIEGNVLCLQTRDSLVGIDPLSGRTLWTRSDVSPRSHVFGHNQVLFVVEISEQNKITGTRALRAYDGASIKIPDFAALYEKRVGRSGRTLVLHESGPGGGSTLRFYDLTSGKDVWKGAFPAGSVLLKSVDANLTGMIEPDGKMRVIDVTKRKEVLVTRADPRHFAGAAQVWLLADAQDYFLAINQPQTPQVQQLGGIQSNLMPGAGLLAIPVNGELYCFDGSNGKMRWRSTLPNQMLVLEHFRELPMVLCTARTPQGRRAFQTRQRR